MHLAPLYLTATLVALVLGVPGFGQEQVRAVDLCDNGDFEEAPPAFQVAGIQPIPWWDTAGGGKQLEASSGSQVLRTGPGEYAFQDVALYAPLADQLVVSGRVQGRGRVTIQDGENARAVLEVGDGSDIYEEFVWTGAQLSEALGHAPVPRLILHLAGAEGEVARWDDLEVQVALPLPTPEALRAEIAAELDWILALWPNQGGDVTGVPTTFLNHSFDVITGERLTAYPGVISSYTHILVAAAEAAPDQEGWVARRDAVLEDVLTRSVHPESGLVQYWDCAEDRPLTENYLEVGGYLRLLLELIEQGHEPHATRARQALRRACDTILRTGLTPDGEVIARYRSRDGETNLGYSTLRRLDVPASLAGAARVLEDPSLLDAAREAVGQFEYSHRWAGSWLDIDPAFDDEFGHYGERAVSLWEAAPDEPTFRHLARSGMTHFLPMWHDALRLGGNIAADQVRCWEIAARVAHLDPELRPEIARRLRAAVRVHFKGQQYFGGAWGDVTVYRFDPEIDLQVGDTFGPPQNLMHGIAIAYDPLLAAEEGGPDLEELRALFSAVLRSTRETYRRPYGYLGSRIEAAGPNESIGSMRVAAGLVLMLENLQ
ncbi:MAG: hypothetical protein O2816_05355 [Planctomycetota bacterium]|nr:hypothetical protein [Planctomycetota bacterium]